MKNGKKVHGHGTATGATVPDFKMRDARRIFDSHNWRREERLLVSPVGFSSAH
jgi:hypothetical protein